MSNTTDFVPFEWDREKFAPIRLAFSELERELNVLLDNEFTWSVFVTPVLVVLTTFLLAFSAMDFVFVLHGAFSFAAFLFVRLKQISGRLLSKLTSVTRFLLRLSGATFAVSLAGILSGPFYRFSQNCNEQLSVVLLESISNLTIFANEHVVPVLETMLENINTTMSQGYAFGWAFASETFDRTLETSFEIWGKCEHVFLSSEMGQASSQVIIYQVSSYVQQIFHLTKEVSRRNNEMNLELLGACLVVFTLLSCVFKLLTRKTSSPAATTSKVKSVVESSQIEIEELSEQASSHSKDNYEQQVLNKDDFQASSSTPIKSPGQVEASRVAMTPFMTPISVVMGKDYSDSLLNNENDENENEPVDNIMLEFSECMTSVKPPAMNNQEGISVIDLSLDEDDDNNDQENDDAMSIHSPSPAVAVRSRSTQAEASVDVADEASSIAPPMLTGNQAKIGLMVTVLGGQDNQRGSGRRLRRGGVGKITMIHDNGTVDVKFMIERGQETRVPMDCVLVGSHPNAVGIAAASINNKSSEPGLDGYPLRAGARDSLATRRRLSALTDLSNLSDHSAASGSKPSSTSSSSTTTTTKKPLYRAQRTSDVANANTSSSSGGGVTTRASLRTRRASLE